MLLKSAVSEVKLQPRFNKDLFGLIGNYGCWCYFDKRTTPNRINLGKGLPIDEFDELCQSYQNAMRCFYQDYKDDEKLNSTHSVQFY